MVFAVTLLEMRILFVITIISNMNKKHAFFNTFHYKNEDRKVKHWKTDL